MKSGIYAKQILNTYEAGIEELMDEDILKVEKYIAICNNTI